MTDSHVCELVCWVCGHHVTIEIDRPLGGAGDFFYLLQREGWPRHCDWERSRVLAFCSLECYQTALTKRGTIRAYPPKRRNHGD